MIFVARCNIKFGFTEFIQDVANAFGQQNLYLFYNFFGYELNMIKNYQRQPERRIILTGVIDMILSANFNDIPEELWKLMLNAVIENIDKRANNKINLFAYRDNDDAGSIGLSGLVVAGSKSNFQKLSYFAKQQREANNKSTADLIEEEKFFVIRFNQLFQDFNTKQMVIAYIDQKFTKTLQQLFA